MPLSPKIFRRICYSEKKVYEEEEYDLEEEDDSEEEELESKEEEEEEKFASEEEEEESEWESEFESEEEEKEEDEFRGNDFMGRLRLEVVELRVINKKLWEHEKLYQMSLKCENCQESHATKECPYILNHFLEEEQKNFNHHTLNEEEESSYESYYQK